HRRLAESRTRRFWRTRPPPDTTTGRPTSGGTMTESRARHQPATAHHEAPAAGAYVTELKLPAVGDYIVVAKRAAASLGLVVGFSVEEIDDLNIAITQACESAIAAATQQWGSGNGQLTLVFKSRPRRLEVRGRSVP